MLIVEDHPPGYPQFSALIGSHDQFQICRRFSDMRSRLLLLKQDRLAVLEAKLRTLDRNETEPLFLGSCRANKNTERELILSEIDEALSDYGRIPAYTGGIFANMSHR